MKQKVLRIKVNVEFMIVNNFFKRRNNNLK